MSIMRIFLSIDMALQDVDDNDSDSEREVLWVKDNSEQESADK